MPLANIHFTIAERKIYLRVFDIVFSLLGLYFIHYFFDFEYFCFTKPNSLQWVILLAFYLLFFGEIFELYNLRVASDKYLTLRSVFISVIFTTLFYVFTPILAPILPQNRIQILYFSLAIVLPILVNRIIYIQLIHSPRFLKNILIIAEREVIEKILSIKKVKLSKSIVVCISDQIFNNSSSLKFKNIHNVNISSTVTEYGINEIIVSSSYNHFITPKINKQLIELFEKGMNIRSVDSFFEEETARISENQLTSNFYNYFTFSKSHQNNLYLVFRRIFDIVFALVGILLFIVLIPFVLIGNLIANRGKLLYFQKRVGKKGVEFSIIKFRTMIKNAEVEGVAWAQKYDNRITPFGRLLRKTRLDEMPQFINVFKGEMSLIGPRPERPEFVKLLEKELPFYAIRHVMKPGLTGWAQVKHPYANTLIDQRKKLMFDLYYIKERNLLLDFKIVIKTISTILFFRGT